MSSVKALVRANKLSTKLFDLSCAVKLPHSISQKHYRSCTVHGQPEWDAAQSSRHSTAVSFMDLGFNLGRSMEPLDNTIILYILSIEKSQVP